MQQRDSKQDSVWKMERSQNTQNSFVQYLYVQYASREVTILYSLYIYKLHLLQSAKAEIVILSLVRCPVSWKKLLRFQSCLLA